MEHLVHGLTGDLPEILEDSSLNVETCALVGVGVTLVSKVLTGEALVQRGAHHILELFFLWWVVIIVSEQLLVLWEAEVGA
jgi:hypothetical protein